MSRDAYTSGVRDVTELLAKYDPVGIAHGADDVPVGEYEDEAREIVRRAVVSGEATDDAVRQIVLDVLTDAFSADDIRATADISGLCRDIVGALGSDGTR
jgi:hypothetical protein